MKILLLRPDKAGDAIKTLPALRALQRQLPLVRISILCSAHNASVFAFERGIRVFSLPVNWESLSEADLRSALSLLPFEVPYDVSINLQCDFFEITEKLLELISSKKRCSVKRGLHLPNSTPAARPEEENIADLIGQALELNLLQTVGDAHRAPTLSEIDKEEALRILGPKFQKRFALCPLAGTDQRSHSLKRWKHFIQLISRFSPPAEFYLFGAKSDRPLLEAMKGKSTALEIVHPSSFRALAAYFESMDGVIAVDSGPLHLAQALSVPSLGILSGGDFKRWFSRLTPADRLIPRGRFSRYPGLLEMFFAYKSWCP